MDFVYAWVWRAAFLLASPALIVARLALVLLRPTYETWPQWFKRVFWDMDHGSHD